jgi:hypothetical protein
LETDRGIAVGVRPVSGPLEQALSSLLPLTDVERRRYGMIALEVFGPRNIGLRNYVRALNAANDGGRWVFLQTGEPSPFEKLEQYQARRVKDRFTFDMLEEYLHQLGLSPFDEDFYLPAGAPAWLVEKTGLQNEYTLAQTREGC